MYESFFGMEHTPFVRDIPAEKLYESDAFRETLGRLCYVADRQMFAVVTADPGCGKSTLIRRFYSELPREEYIILYLSDSKLTPRWFYKGMLDQLGLEARFYRGDSKRQLQQQIEIIHGVQHKKVVCVLDEAHLLEKETLEEFRFLLNYFQSVGTLRAREGECEGDMRASQLRACPPPYKTGTSLSFRTSSIENPRLYGRGFSYLSLQIILPLDRSYGESSIVTLSPGRIRIKFIRSLPLICARTTCLFSSSTLNMAFGSFSRTVPSTSITSAFDIINLLCRLSFCKSQNFRFAVCDQNGILIMGGK